MKRPLVCLTLVLSPLVSAQVVPPAVEVVTGALTIERAVGLAVSRNERAAIADTTGHVVTDAEFARLKGQLLATGFAISLGPGIFVVLAGGLLAAAGALADLADGQRTSPDVPPMDPTDAPSVAPPPHVGRTTSPEPTPPGTSI